MGKYRGRYGATIGGAIRLARRYRGRGGGSKTLHARKGRLRVRPKLRTRFRFGYAPTGTRTKSKIGKMTGSVSGTVSHFKKYNKGRMVSKIMKNNMSGLCSWGTVNATRVASLLTNQKWASVVFMAGQADFNTLRGQVQSNQSADMGITIPTKPFSTHIFIESISGILTMTSSSLFNMDVTILDLKSKDRHGFTPEVAFSTGLADNQNTFGAESPDELNSYPTMSRYFKKYWAIEGKSQFVLGAGQIHKHNFKITLNKMMSFVDLQNPTTFFEVSRALFVNVRGYPCHSSTSEVTVTLAPSAVDCITNYTIKYRTSYGSIGYVSLENNLPVFETTLIDGVNEFTSVFTNGFNPVS